jgi:squalene-hopene/tetraprenyl-beta-curcumene cyclase
MARAVDFVTERLNGEDGLGAIYPAIANSVMMFNALGYPPDHPHAATAWSAVRKLLCVKPDHAYCQPCLSPIWDSALSGHAIAEADGLADDSLRAACDWLREREITETLGDWSLLRPGLAPGGWAFQYNNAHYPDVDDTAVVGLLLHRQGDPAHDDAIQRARRWVVGMQSSNGGWGAFDAENTHYKLNHIPFADHGALLDPPTADVTARCVSFLAQLGQTEDAAVIARALDYLRREQEACGAWSGLPPEDPMIRRAVDWLIEVQREDGGWGEDEESYAGATPGMYQESTASQTAWALLGLMAAGEIDHPAVARGIAYLSATQRDDGEWTELPYTAVGFPRVFYLRYHGYRLFFPLLAMARYRNLQRSNLRRVDVGF